MEDTLPPKTAPASAFEARAAALRARVAEAARALTERGVQPTVARIRAALGGGSPNDLAPALKQWREAAHADSAGLRGVRPPAGRRIPPPIADLALELWQRATAAAVLELKHGPTAQTVAARTEEVQGLRTQLTAMREQLARDAVAYGELRAQAARHETLARHALGREKAAETRARELARALGEARQTVAQLTAELTQRPRPARRAASQRRRNSAHPRRRIAATPSKRVKRTSRVRAAAARARRAAPQKSPLRRSHKKSKTATGGKRRKILGQG